MTSDELRALARVEQRRRATGADRRQPTYCIVTAPAEQMRDPRIQARLRAALPRGLLSVAWCSDNGRDLAGCGLTVGGTSDDGTAWMERRPLPKLPGIPVPPAGSSKDTTTAAPPLRARRSKYDVLQVDDDGEPLPPDVFKHSDGTYHSLPEGVE